MGCRKGSQVLQNILPSCDNKCLIILSLQWFYWSNQQNPSKNIVISLKLTTKLSQRLTCDRLLWGFFVSFWFFLLRREVRFGVFYRYYSQPVSWPDPWIPTWWWRSVSLLSCNVTLVTRPIHPLQVFSFSSQNTCPKGQKKGFAFKCITLSEPFTLRASWGPALSCVFSFLFVWSLPGSDLLVWPYWEAML